MSVEHFCEAGSDLLEQKINLNEYHLHAVFNQNGDIRVNVHKKERNLGNVCSFTQFVQVL